MAHKTNITIITSSKRLNKDKISTAGIEEETGREKIWTMSSRRF